MHNRNLRSGGYDVGEGGRPEEAKMGNHVFLLETYFLYKQNAVH